MRKKLDTLRLKLRRHGAAAAAYEAVVKGLGGVADFKILRGVFVARPDPAFLDCPYQPMLLTEAQLREYARDPANEISPEFIDEATARGDQCYAICDGGRLAAYGWYAFSATPIGLPGVLLHYSPGYVYMYKGFTRALQHYLSKGYRGIVSYVESINFDSLKSCFRMGYSVFGTVYVVKAFGRYYGFSTPGCRKYAFRVARVAGPSAPGL